MPGRRRCCCEGPTCSPCSIPTHDLTGTFVDVPLPPETITLTYYPTGGGSYPIWQGITADGSLLFELQCSTGTMDLGITDTSDGSPWVGGFAYIASWTCTPFHVHFGIGVGSSTFDADE